MSFLNTRISLWGSSTHGFVEGFSSPSQPQRCDRLGVVWLIMPFLWALSLAHSVGLLATCAWHASQSSASTHFSPFCPHFFPSSVRPFGLPPKCNGRCVPLPFCLHPFLALFLSRVHSSCKDESFGVPHKTLDFVAGCKVVGFLTYSSALLPLAFVHLTFSTCLVTHMPPLKIRSTAMAPRERGVRCACRLWAKWF